MLEISDIEKISTLAKEGSFTKASRSLNISQPTLTKRISRLEDTFGIKLFHRSFQGVLPTEFCKVIIHDGEDILSLSTMLDHSIAMLAGKKHGSIVIATGPIIEEGMLVEIITKIHDIYPSIKIITKTDSSKQLLKLLKSGAVDIAIGSMVASDQSAQVHIEHLAQKKTLFMARPQHPLLSKGSKKITIEQLLKFQWASPEMPLKMQSWLEHNCHDHPQDYCNIVSNNYSLLRHLAKNSDHIITGPDFVFKDDIKHGNLAVLPLDETFYWESYIAMRPETALTPLAKAITTIIKEVSSIL